MKSFLTVSMLLIAAFISTLLGGCGGSSNATTGSATAKLVWQEAATSKAVKSAAPAGVATVRVIITAAGMTTIQQDYAAATGSVSISAIPAGINRTFTFQGLNAGGSVTHQAVVPNVTITAGTTTDLGSITMLVVVAPAAPSGLGALSISTSSITISWTNSDQLETGFVIERKTGAGGVWAQIATPAAHSVSYSNSGLTAATSYYYRIKATNGVGASAWSNEANVQTATIDLAKTGQTTSYAAGDDGALQKGVAWPSPRFTDNGDGTVTDNLTGLIWLKNANCFGVTNWADALTSANGLASGACGLTDGSNAGQWRLPNIVELESLLDAGRYEALPTGHPFTEVESSKYWSSNAGGGPYAWTLNLRMVYGSIVDYDLKVGSLKGLDGYVWPVRTGAGGTLKLPKTGQTISYAPGDDGDLQNGAAWPNPRFTDNANGTVTDNLTGLIWLKNANCTQTVAGVDKSSGWLTWANALTWSSGLASGACGLSDGSSAGQWRLPNRKELWSLMINLYSQPAGHPFTEVRSFNHWTSTTFEHSEQPGWIESGWNVSGYSVFSNPKDSYSYVWPVRGGQ